METQKYFIKTFNNGDGILLTVDKISGITKRNNLFWNPLTSILVIEFFLNGKIQSIKTTCTNFDIIKITKE